MFRTLAKARRLANAASCGTPLWSWVVVGNRALDAVALGLHVTRTTSHFTRRPRLDIAPYADLRGRDIGDADQTVVVEREDVVVLAERDTTDLVATSNRGDRLS